MNKESRSHTIEELAESVGVPIRTIRFYITQGLIPGPGSRGKSATYTEEHLLRLRLVRRLTEQRVPLADIKQQLDDLSLDDVRFVLGEEEKREKELYRAAQATSPKAYVSELLKQAQGTRKLETGSMPLASRLPVPLGYSEPSESLPVPKSPAGRSSATWQRWQLMEGLELHVRSDVEKSYLGLIKQVLQWVDGLI